MQLLRRLLAIDIKVLAPGMGILTEDPHAEVDRLIRHRLRREDKVRQALMRSANGATVQGLLPFAYDDVPKTLYEMAALSLQAHLEKLVEDGELLCVESRYSRI